MFKGVFRALSLNQQKYFQFTYKMPKKKSITEGKNKSCSEKSASSQNNDKGAVYLGNNNVIIVKIHAKPGAKESAVTDIGSEAVGIQIGAPPVDGEANKELIRYLAEILNLRKSDLCLDKGSRSKEKIVVISKDIPLSVVLEALNAASKQ